MGSPLPPKLTILLVLVALATAAELPPTLKTCKQTDPDFNGCLAKAFQDAAPILRNGIPSLGLPPLDPLHFTQIKIEDTPERPVSLNLEFNEVDVFGIGIGIVDSVEMKPGSYHMKVKMHSETTLSLIGRYKAEGKVLVLPVKGEGNCNITAPRLEVVVEMSGQPVVRDGEAYWDVTDYKVDIILDQLSIDLTGLFNNDKALAENTLKFLNENSVEIAMEVKPALEEALAVSFKEMARRVFGKVPYNSVFPPS